WSFWRDAGWLQLCAGLAIFLFGMQCLEEGLRQLAGGRLEQLLARSTGTPLRGLLFGVGGTVLLQSSTLVSLLTIAFISSGLIQLAGGLAIIFGANLGATSGIWLLALAGQGFSLSPLALPMLVRAGVGATGVLQSSQATLMLILAAQAAGQLELGHALALAIGSNVGSSVSTGVVGALGGNRSGQRLALAHVLFNLVSAGLALTLLAPLTWLVVAASGLLGFGDNALLQLALFHTLFNVTGVAVFWPWQARLARWLQAWLPDRADPVLAPDAVVPAAAGVVRARYLSGQALDSADAAAA